MTWSTLYFDSVVGASAGAAQTTILGGIPNYALKISLCAETKNNCAVGTLLFTIRYKDRDGNNSSYVSPPLSLSSASGKLSDDTNIYLSSNGADNVTLEITPVGVVGSFQYTYWLRVEGDQAN